MFIKITSFIILLMFSFNSSAEVKKNSSTIPFATYTYTYINTTSQARIKNFPANLSSEASLSNCVIPIATKNNVPTTEVINFIKMMKNSICNSIDNADVRVWISVEAGTNKLLISVNGQTGLEVTFHCTNSRK